MAKVTIRVSHVDCPKKHELKRLVTLYGLDVVDETDKATYYTVDELQFRQARNAFKFNGCSIERAEGG